MASAPAAPTRPPLTLGTAGHIDHGKTVLVEVLTGVNTDRLPEERSRGISIELGFAPLVLPSGRRLSVVDVPGHERFVRTMVAGATGIDCFLMVIAADDGVMPQTREHAAVLAGLAVAQGVVAITKCDVAEPGAALAEAAELYPDAETVAVSARTGEGVAELLAALDRVAARLPGRAADAAGSGAARLHVDRAFTVRGAGTVVTGTLWAGSAGRGDTVEILPAGRRARVRAVQVHEVPVERALAGQRVALNLAGVEVRDVRRGDVVAGAGAPGTSPSYVLDVALELAPEARDRLDHGARVHAHHGTREAPGRAVPLGGRFWQLRLERPLLAAAGDRLVVRQVAPPDTLGGGTVVDPAARKHGPTRDGLARLERLARGEPEAAAPEAQAAVPGPAPAPELGPGALAAEARLRAAGREPPPDADLGAAAADLAALRAAGRAVRLGRGRHVHAEALAAVRVVVLARLEADGSITLAQLRDELGTSRLYAQAFLERFDDEKLTRRTGDARVLRRRHRADG